MKRISDKIHLIFKPVLIISIGFIAAYSFLHWALFIKENITPKETILKFWLPFTLPCIPVLIWLRPRIQLLEFKNQKGFWGYIIISCLIISIPTIIAQEYLIKATGKITTVENVNQIDKKEKTKYYLLKNCYIDKQHVVI